MMKKDIGVIGAIFTCGDCGKEFVAYKNAQAIAAKHATHYKHYVSGEVTLFVEYDGRK